jgi:hypothetical protein
MHAMGRVETTLDCDYQGDDLEEISGTPLWSRIEVQTNQK